MRDPRRPEGDRRRDPIEREPGARVDLADRRFVGGRDEREHDLVDRHDDGPEVPDRVPLVGHRPCRVVEPPERLRERLEVDIRPVALDEERVHVAAPGSQLPSRVRGDYPDQSIERATSSAMSAPDAISAPSSAREWMPSFSYTRPTTLTPGFRARHD